MFHIHEAYILVWKNKKDQTVIFYRISYFILPAAIGVILYIHEFGMNFKALIKSRKNNED